MPPTEDIRSGCRRQMLLPKGGYINVTSDTFACLFRTLEKIHFAATVDSETEVSNSCDHFVTTLSHSNFLNTLRSRCQSTDNDSENDLDYDTYDSTTYLTKKNASVKSRGSSKSSQDSAEFGHGDYDTVSTSSGGRNGSAGSNSAIVLPPQYEVSIASCVDCKIMHGTRCIHSNAFSPPQR